MTNHYPNEQDALANLRRKYEALEAERDAALNKAESLGWAVDALKQSVETMERRAGEFKAERDQFVVLSDALQEVINQMRAIVETEK